MVLYRVQPGYTNSALQHFQSAVCAAPQPTPYNLSHAILLEIPEAKKVLYKAIRKPGGE